MKKFSTIARKGFRFSTLAIAISLFAVSQANAQSGAQSTGEPDGQTAGQSSNECVRYLENTRAPQYHSSIDMLKPHVIIGPQGTEVLIPENAFVKEDGSPVEGEVVINFSEFLNKSDLILSNLPTMSNGRLLESGGVIYLEALSDGQKLKLAAGKSVLVNFPGGAQEGMRLFKGKYDPSGTMDWVQMSDSPEHYNKPQPQRAVAKEGAFPIFSDFGPVQMPKQTFRDKPEYTIQAYVESMLEKYYNCRGKDDIYVELTVNGAGRAEKVRTLTGKNACLRLAVEEILQTLAYSIDAAEGAEFYFSVAPEISAPASQNDNMFASMAGQPMSLTATDVEGTMAKVVERERARNFVKNAFEVTDLGYINCDRFAAENVPMVASTITLNRKELSNNAKVFMVFDDMNSVMEASPSAYGEFRFGRVPSGRSVTIVAVAYEPNVGPWISMQKVKVSEGKLAKLEMEKSSDASVKQALASL